MADLEVTGLVLGMIETNSYIVGNRQTKEALLIDPSDGEDRIMDFLAEKEYRPVAIYLTHGHDDHFGSVNELKREYGLLTYIMKEEEEFVQSVNFNLSGLFRHPRVTGVMHSFSGSPEMALQYAKRGWYVSFSGTVSFKNARKVTEAAAVVPADLILIDVPPINIVSDPMTLSGLVAGALFVVRQGFTDHREIRKALVSAEMTGMNILGFVFYGEKLKQGSYYRRKQYQNYYHRYDSREQTGSREPARGKGKWN